MTFEEYLKEKGVSNTEYALRGILNEAYTYGADWWILGADSWRTDFYEHNDWDTPCYCVPDSWEEAKSIMANASDWPVSDDRWTLTHLIQALEESDTHYADDLLEQISDAKYEGAYEGWKDALKEQERRNAALTEEV